ncbi:hypothetical protein D623_10007409 [Myotis brandtii]|uniref:Uncharacterized protein n=1 Tax=Myotis brandtii TaxID=109478 RepID=S7Q5B3_MYOBR|nr:hypothetical protein D623_10007409 [Myotis brandtii]
MARSTTPRAPVATWSSRELGPVELAHELFRDTLRLPGGSAVGPPLAARMGDPLAGSGLRAIPAEVTCVLQEKVPIKGADQPGSVVQWLSVDL